MIIFLEQSGYCLKVFCLSQSSLSQSTGQRKQAFVEPFVSMLVGISWLLASSALSLECVRQTIKTKQTTRKPQTKAKESRKPRGAHHHAVPWILRSLANLPSLTFPSFNVCFTYNIQRFWLYFAEEIGKARCIYSIFLKVRVFFCSFIVVNIPFYADIRTFFFFYRQLLRSGIAWSGTVCVLRLKLPSKMVGSFTLPLVEYAVTPSPQSLATCSTLKLQKFYQFM